MNTRVALLAGKKGVDLLGAFLDDSARGILAM
jgi:hypothetical protein